MVFRPLLSTFIGLAKKAVWVFHNILWKNSNALSGQPNISSECGFQTAQFVKLFYFCHCVMPPTVSL